MIRRREINIYDGEFFDILNLVFLRQFCNEKYVKKFEESFANYIGTKYAITTCTGRDGMMLLLDVLKLKKGDEIIFPAYTLKDLIISVQEKGFKPVLVDIEKDSFNINANLIEEKITNKTKVIVATHMFGLPCNIKKIKKIAESYGIDVIEDCCHAHGAEFEGKKVGTFGIGGFFSFHQIKLINTFGGGMITTSDDKIANYVRKKLRRNPCQKKEILKKIFSVYLEDFALKSPLFYLFSTMFYFKSTKKLFNNLYLSFSKHTRVKSSKYSDIQAFLALKQLDSLDERINKRRENTKFLKKLLDRRIQVQKTDINCKHVFYYFVIKSNFGSEKLQRNLLSRGLDVGIKDEIIDDCTNTVKEFSEECSVTHDVFNHAIQIPIYESLTKEKIYRIANILNEVMK